MANANRPSGLSPVKHLTGAPFNGQGNIYQIPAADTNAYAIGDPVISSGSADVNGVPGIIIYGGTGAIRGVILGLGTAETLLANPNNLNSTIRPGAAQATDWYALVADSPDLIFEVQENSNGTALAAGDIGMNTILKSGTNNGYISGWLLSSATDATPATTNTLAFRLLGLARRNDNAYGAFAKHLVYPNVHELGHGPGAVGVA